MSLDDIRAAVEGRPRNQLLRLFWERVPRRPKGECWEWIGARRKDGYGTLWRPDGARPRNWRAHRLSWTLLRGPIPRGMWVLHHCDNPPCVNPDHLYLGTVVENARDRTERKRWTSPNSLKTHCLNGHPFSGENLRLDTLGRRCCRTCIRARLAKSRTGGRRRPVSSTQIEALRLIADGESAFYHHDAKTVPRGFWRDAPCFRKTTIDALLRHGLLQVARDADGLGVVRVTAAARCVLAAREGAK